MSGDAKISAVLETLLAAKLVQQDEQGVGYAKSGMHHELLCPAEAIRAAATVYREAGFFLEMVTCLDLRETARRMRLVYTFNRLGPAERHRLFVDLAEVKPFEPSPNVKSNATPATDPPALPQCAPSISSVYPAADWFEREIFDMFGVQFSEHPNLKRLLLPEDADFHALLRDFGRVEDADQGEGGRGV
ncbi:MAG: NADH-quinone oxidoreductase subunit C [Deltaproteobacteria bacterium]|nr:NADH-quinone oxidoreductase subunit C [Deltaproteobacteria bacterium]